ADDVNTARQERFYLANSDSRDLGVLPRQCGRVAYGRRNRRGCAGRTVHAAQTRCTVAAARDRVLPVGSRNRPEQPRLRRLLRQAAREVRTSPGDLFELRAERVALVPRSG